MESKISLGISSSAVEDIELITAWYEQQRTGLSLKFVSEIDISFNKISTSPEAFRLHGKNSFVRRYIMEVFPYKIFYHYNSFHIEIIAVIHTSRSSRYLKRRLK